ncbi:hypothetical protein ES707_19278 [subsurface metagenome]
MEELAAWEILYKTFCIASFCLRSVISIYIPISPLACPSITSGVADMDTGNKVPSFFLLMVS